MMFKGAKYTSQKCQPDKCPQLFTWCRTRSAEMPTCWRTKGKGHSQYAKMPKIVRPSQPITGGHRQNAEMPLCYRPHQFTRCQTVHAEMLLKVRTQGKGHLGNAKMPKIVRPSQPITGGHACSAEMLLILPPHRIWAMRYSQKCQATAAQITPTRGQLKSAK
jgi:hypothetical protein